MKLITKITLIIASLVIAILILTAFSVFSLYEKSIKETVAQQQFLMISILADELDSKLLVAQQHLCADAKTMPPDIMRNPAKAQAILDDKQGLHTMFDNHLFLFTPSGQLFVESPDTGRRGFDFSFREYMINTIKTKKPYISDPYVSRQPHKHPVIMFTAPILDSKGRIEGILTGGIDLMRDNFLGRLNGVKIGKTGYLYLTATDRTMIMHVDKKRILTKQAPGLNRLYDKAIEGFEGTDNTTTSYGVKMVSSFKRLKAKNWILGANYPLVEAYHPIQQAKQYFVIATIIVIIAVFFIISFIIKSLLNPLELFTRHIEGLPQKTGNNRFLNINTEDEIGTLSGAFNNMVAEIDSKRVALQRSEELYRTVTEFSADFVFWTAPDYKVIYVSQNCEKFCGYTPEEFYSSPELMETIIHPDDRAVWTEHIHHSNKHDLNEQLELRMITKSGQLRWISHNCLPVYDKEGNCKGLRGSHRDITERKRAEEKLDAAQQLFMNIIEFLPDATLVVDSERKVIAWNRELERMTGVRKEEIIGKGDYACSVPFYGEKRPILLDLTGMKDSEIEKKYDYVHKEGNILYAEVFLPSLYQGRGAYVWASAAPLFDKEGNQAGAIETVRDITNHKKAEEQIRRSLREKETLLKEIHHRVKNNMAIVSSLLALQSEQIEDETVKAMFEDSQHRIRAMAFVHEKLYQTTNFSEIDFEDYINTIVQELLSSFNIEGKDITTKMDVAGIKLELEDAIPCGLIINELLTNSFKYAFPGDKSGEIAISFTKSDDIYTLTIKDNGIGLPEDFEYKQTSTLGLQLVNVLANQLRGDLQMNFSGGTEAVIKFRARGDNDGKEDNTDS